jgi:hypothetical protein
MRWLTDLIELRVRRLVCRASACAQRQHRSDCAATGRTETLAWILTDAFAIAADDCDGVFLSVDIDIDVCDPGTGKPEPGG